MKLKLKWSEEKRAQQHQYASIQDDRAKEKVTKRANLQDSGNGAEMELQPTLRKGLSPKKGPNSNQLQDSRTQKRGKHNQNNSKKLRSKLKLGVQAETEAQVESGAEVKVKENN